ncbi:MAG TPA: DUF11 domain-containing protein [Actinomycetota bacterium]|nr:DUF11 domain-containing protein [Actinomycetota bacterium]
MHRAGRRRTLAGAAFVLLAALGLVAGSAASSAVAAGLCATPGGEGAGGTLTGVVNTYYPGVGTAAAGATSIDVGAPSGAAATIAAGDLLLVIQMQDADFDPSNTGSYGHGGGPAAPSAGYTALNATGRYEYVRATSGVVAGSVAVEGTGTGGGLVNAYRSAAGTGAAGQRTFQVVRVPQYASATTSSGLTAAAWNGAVGGVLALDVSGSLTLGGTVSVDGLGFRGAPGLQRGGAGGFSNTDTAVSATANVDGNKGEGIAGTPLGTTAGNGYPGGDAARGAPGNAGGGGTDGNPNANDQNTGGGGGGNGGAGGQGGNAWFSGIASGGYGGVALPATSGRVFLGGGGGSGTTNNHAAPQADGAAGGGIVLIRTGSLGGGGSITANGADAYDQTLNDGGGGGGGGGSIVLTSPFGSLATANLSAHGGNGGDAWPTQPGAGSAHGPGGGGGGGWIITSGAVATEDVGGGAHGTTTTGNLTYGSFDGDLGQTASSSSIPGVSGGAECVDLSVAKTGPATVIAGGRLAYHVSVANAGPARALDVSVADTLASGTTFVSASGSGWTCAGPSAGILTCTRASLAAGTTAPPISVVVRAPAHAGSITNTARVSTSSPDTDPSNDEDAAVTQVTASADLSITKTGPATVDAGGSLTYAIEVANAGPSPAADVSVVDTQPAGTTFVSASGSGWTCDGQSAGVVTCTRASIAAGATAPTITVVLTAPRRAGTITNVARVSSSTPDPTPADTTASRTSQVLAAGGTAGTGADVAPLLRLQLVLLLLGGMFLAIGLRRARPRGRHELRR